jgi:hypothetical protein
LKDKLVDVRGVPDLIVHARRGARYQVQRKPYHLSPYHLSNMVRKILLHLTILIVKRRRRRRVLVDLLSIIFH